MKRFIRYLYEYEQGRRLRNVGFVKAEQDEDECTLHIHGKGLYMKGERQLTVYLFFEDGDECVGIWQGTVDNVNPAINYRLHYTEEGVGGIENFRRLNGIVMESELGHRYAAVWNDTAVNVDKMRVLDSEQARALTQEPKAAKENASVQEGSVQREEETAGQERDMRRGNAGREGSMRQENAVQEGSMRQENAGREEETAGQERSMRQENAGREEETAGQERSMQQENAGWEEETAEREGSMRQENAGREEETAGQERSMQQENVVQREDAAVQESTVSQEDIVLVQEEPGEGSESVWEAEDQEMPEASGKADFGKLSGQGRVRADQSGIVICEDMKGTEQEVSGQQKEEKRALQGTCQCTKIRRNDLARLPRCEWKWANNSFLLHGYYNYHHLALLNDGSRFMLGVPGIYHPQEAKAANVFGFTEFIPIREIEIDLSDDERDSQEQFGYWCRPVKRPLKM